MSERTMRIVFSSGISNLVEKNSSFDSGVLRVAYTGKNRNNSFISKETYERCIQSIYNCPIVCNYDRETDTIGSHDIELVSTDDGGMKIVNITQPVGVIPESAKYWWEEIEDNSGVHEYLCVDALIWKRQEAYRKIKDDGITDESMEISIKEGEMVDGMYVIKRFEFTAFCLLGTAEPCFESASLEMFSCDGFKQQLAEMMQEFKEAFTTAQPSKEVGIHPQNYSEGGEEVLEQKVALMAEFGLTIATNAGVRMQSDGESFVVTSTRIVASTDIDTSSDRRLKNNISSDLDRYIPFFMRLQPSVYRFNSGRSGRFHTGFIAQEVEDALRDSGLSTQDFAGLVKCSGLNDAHSKYTDEYSLRYAEFISLNTYMIQRLYRRIDELEQKLQAIEA